MTEIPQKYYGKQSSSFFQLLGMSGIVSDVIDHLSHSQVRLTKQKGEASGQEIQKIITKILELQHELKTERTLKHLPANTEDLKKWNEFLPGGTKRYDDNFYFSARLYAECYFYRRLQLIFDNTQTLKNYDYFKNQKDKLLVCCLRSIKGIGASLEQKNIETEDEIRDWLHKLIKLNLWGNRCDLAMSSYVKVASDPFAGLQHLDKFILSNQSDEIYNCLKSFNGEADVQIINDNAGYELFTDFVLADYLIEHKLAKKITFNLKAIPWFISDALEHDVEFLFSFLSDTKDDVLVRLNAKWRQRFQTGDFVIHKPLDHFWTTAYEYCKMNIVDPELYDRLSKSQLLIFKGDLNYRKLLADFYWDPTTTFKDSLNGFLPTNLCALRTLKADVISGLESGIAERLSESEPYWMVTGEYGVIQFAGK